MGINRNAGGGCPAPGSYSRKEGNNMKKQTAVAAIAETLEALKAYAVDDHLGVNPEAVNWGNVGTAQHLLSLLNEAAKFAGV